MHQKEKRSMDHFAGLDVSVKETSVCIVDDTGRIIREVKVASEPEALLHVLGDPCVYRKPYPMMISDLVGKNSLFLHRNSLFRRNNSLFCCVGNLAESL
jgi:hypothetical protein